MISPYLIDKIVEFDLPKMGGGGSKHALVLSHEFHLRKLDNLKNNSVNSSKKHSTASQHSSPNLDYLHRATSCYLVSYLVLPGYLPVSVLRAVWF